MSEGYPRAPHRLYYYDGVIGASVDVGWYDLTGYSRLRGNIHLFGGAAANAGYPRLVLSSDKSVNSLIITLGQDATQADTQYPFDVALDLPYVKFQLTFSAPGNMLATIMAFPD